MPEEVEQPELPGAGLFTVHCIFGYCSYVAESADPKQAHALMEQHYDERHSVEIDQICYRLTGRPKIRQSNAGKRPFTRITFDEKLT